jgi:hypothetical protein
VRIETVDGEVLVLTEVSQGADSDGPYLLGRPVREDRREPAAEPVRVPVDRIARLETRRVESKRVLRNVGIAAAITLAAALVVDAFLDEVGGAAVLAASERDVPEVAEVELTNHEPQRGPLR